MESTDLPPPMASQPAIGESGKLRSALDLLNITKILALVIGIISFLLAAWNGIDLAFGWFLSLPSVIYYVISGIINLLIYTKIPEYDAQIRGRRYVEAKDQMLVWAVLGIIFGFLAGLLLLLVIFLYLEDMIRASGRYNAPPPSPPGY